MQTQPMGMTEAQLEELCSAWPGARSVMKWEVDRVWSVGNQMFAAYCTLGQERGRLSLRVEPDRFTDLIALDGIATAPYTARAFWISIVEPELFTLAQIGGLLRVSYELALAQAPQKLQDELLDASGIDAEAR